MRCQTNYAVVLYTIDFYAEMLDWLGREIFSLLLRGLRKIIETDLIRDEQIILTDSTGYGILMRFEERRLMDQRIGNWTRRFGELLKRMQIQDMVPLSAGVYILENDFDSSKITVYIRKTGFAQHLGQFEGDPFIRYYCDEEYQSLKRKRWLEMKIRTACREHQLQAYLQPQYNLFTGKIAGAEALIRWNHPELGLVPPDDFIPLLEQNHCIIKTDFYMLEECCKMLYGWRERGVPIRPVSVNFSRLHAASDDFVPRFLSVTEQYGIHPDELRLEWTESAFMKWNFRAKKIAEQLRSRGFLVAIDDFGTGYSSLNVLADLPVDIIKLDKEFLNFQKGDHRHIDLLEHTVKIVRDLQFTVVVEGIEHRWQSELLKALGCEYAQGFLFSKPIPSAAYEELVSKESSQERPAGQNST